MKNYLSVVVALASSITAGVAMADVTVYGRANLSFEAVETEVAGVESSTTELLSNASRIGFKGSEQLSDQLEAVYQLEYEAYFDDSDTFKQRNIYVGVKGGFGQVIGGHFDTPLKAMQNKIDLFDNLRGDIKNIVTPHDNRTSNTIQYTTPGTLGGFGADIAFINSEVEGVDDGKSIALAWGDEHIYVAGGYDQDVEFPGVEAMRLVMQYNRGAWQLGALYEQTDADFLDDTIAAYMASLLYKIDENWAVKAQHGGSDRYLDDVVVVFEDGRTTSVGVDYIFSKTARIFGFYTSETADNVDLDNSYAGIGMEVKF